MANVYYKITEDFSKSLSDYIEYVADWDYFSKIIKRNPSIVKIDKILFFHD